MKIKNLEISSSVRPKVIAELGINHGGCLDTAKKLAELAINSGADIIKSQFHIAEEEMSNEAKKIVPQHCTDSIFSIIDECSLSPSDEFELKTFIEQSGSIYLSTPFSVKAAHILGKEFGVDAFKIGSGECNNFHILDACIQYNKPMIISTGMNSLDSCRRTVDFLNSKNQRDFILMHTTNLYPTPFELVRLGGIEELQGITSVESVGLSDHTVSNLACLGAVANGAVLLERHFTDSKDRIGPDIENSMDPSDLVDLLRDSKLMFTMRSGSKVSEMEEESDTRNFAFATLVATRSLPAGHRIEFDDFIPKRPSKGDFLSSQISELINLELVQSINEGDHLYTSILNDEGAILGRFAREIF